MYTIICFIVLFSSIFIALSYYNIDDKTICLPAGILGILLGLLIGALVTWYIPAKYETLSSEVILVSLQDNESIKGYGCYLGSGYVHGQMKYTFYYKYGDGFKLTQINADHVTVKYTTGKPRCVTFKKKPVNCLQNHFTFTFACNFYSDSYIIYVPEGTVQNNFKLDAK